MKTLISRATLMCLFWGLNHFAAYSQAPERPLVSDTLYYVTLTINAPPFPNAGIRQKTEMSGVARNLLVQYLSNTSVDSLLASFYRYHHYTPPHEVLEMELIEFFSPGSFEAYAKAHQLDNSRFAYNMNKQSRKITFWLKNGTDVEIRVTRVFGKFWLVDKSDPVMRNMTWNAVTDVEIGERDIRQLQPIQSCYVPYEITWYRKPTGFALRFSR